MFLAPLVAAISMATPASPAPLQTGASDFRPDLFFAGRTRGTGTVRVATSSRPQILAVQGRGRIGADGALDLDQAVTIDGKTSQRSFRVARARDGRWQGTLSDAAGPVTAAVRGNRMTIAYPMKRAGMRMHQTLDLQPGGRTVLNRARVTLLGVTVARIEETIEKLD